MKGAFLKLKRKDFDAMAKHYEDEKEELESRIPLFGRRPFTTTIAAFVIVIWMLMLRGSME